MHPSSRLGGSDGRFAYMAVLALSFAPQTTGRTRRMAIWTGVDVSECFGLLGEEFKAARITCMEDAIDGKALARVHPSELGLTCADWPACVAACLDETHAFRSEDSAVSTKTKCSWNVTGPIQVPLDHRLLAGPAARQLGCVEASKQTIDPTRLEQMIGLRGHVVAVDIGASFSNIAP